MKKSVLILLSLLFSSTLFAQTFWTNRYSASGANFGPRDLAVDPSGDGWLVMNMGSVYPNQPHPILCRVDSNGQLLWTTSVRDSTGDFLYPAGATATRDGGWAVTCEWTNDGFYVFKLDSLGGLMWSYGYSGILSGSTRDIIEDGNGDLYVTGGDCWFGAISVSKLDANGNVLWYNGYCEEGGGGFKLMMNRAGNLMVAGFSFISGQTASGKLNILEVSPAGNIIWSKNYALGFHEFPTGIIEFEEGDDRGYVVVGYGNPPNGTATIVTVDQAGNLLWADSISGPLIANTGALGYNGSGEIVAPVSMTGLSRPGQANVVLLRYSISGQYLGAVITGDSASNAEMNGLAPFGNSGYIGTNYSGTDGFKLQTMDNSLGLLCEASEVSLSPTSFIPLSRIDTAKTASPLTRSNFAVVTASLFLSQQQSCVTTNLETIHQPEISCYPIPANGEIFLELDQPFVGEGKISLFNLRGECILEHSLSTGTLKFELNVEEVKSGVYFLLLESQGELIWDRMLRVE